MYYCKQNCFPEGRAAGAYGGFRRAHHRGFLPPVRVVWTVAVVPLAGYDARHRLTLVRTDVRTKALVVVVFVLSALKPSSAAGSSAHPTGTGVLVVLFGPAVVVLLPVTVSERFG